MKPVYAVGGAVALALIVLAGWFIVRANPQTATLEAVEGTLNEQLVEAGVEEALTEQTTEAEQHTAIENVPSPSLSGTILGKDENPVYVYLPPSYHDSEKRYPTLYILPSGGQKEKIESVGNLISSVIDQPASDNKPAEMIIVIPDYVNSIGSSTFFGDSPVNGDWHSFIARDLVEYIDDNYRTLPDSASRGLMGDIYSGAAALNLAMKHPDIFGVLYLNHPWLFAPGGLAESRFASSLAQMQMSSFISDLQQIPREEAHEKLLQLDSGDLTWDANIALKYGLAFAGDPQLNAPYFEYVYTDIDVPAGDDVWARWEDGFGNIAEKVAANQGNLAQLRAMAISVGEGEAADLWAIDGLRHLSEELTAAGISHEMHSHEADPVAFIEPFAELILPFFSDNLVFEE